MAITQADSMGIVDQRILTATATLYTVPSGKTIVKPVVSFSNLSSTVDAVIKLFLVPMGQAAGDTYQYMAATLLPREVSVDVIIPHDLGAGWMIAAQSTSAVTTMTSGKVLS